MLNSTFKAAMTIRTASGHITGAYSTLVPLATYQLTGSLALSGLFFLIENFVKFSIYLYASSWFQLGKVSSFQTVAEIGRLLSIPVFAGVMYFHGPWWGVAIASILNHIAQAFGNFLYEPRIEKWANGIPHSYLYQIKADLLSGVIATLGVLFLPLNATFIALGIIQAYGVYTLWIHRAAMYQADIVVELARPAVQLVTWAKAECLRPFKSLTQMSSEVWGVALLSMALAWPIAIIFCNIPFFLDDGLGRTVSKEDVALFALARMTISFVALKAYLRFTSDTTSWMARYGTAMLIALLILMLIVVGLTHAWVFVGALIAYNAVVYIMIAKVRSLRQRTIPADHKHRAAITGMAVALDSSLYIIASAILALGLSVSDAYVATYVGSVVLLAGALTLLRHKWIPVLKQWKALRA